MTFEELLIDMGIEFEPGNANQQLLFINRFITRIDNLQWKLHDETHGECSDIELILRAMKLPWQMARDFIVDGNGPSKMVTYEDWFNYWSMLNSMEKAVFNTIDETTQAF